MQQLIRKSSIQLLTIGIAIGITTTIAIPRVKAAVSGPTEHKGLSVGVLAEVPASSLKATIGLEGYKLRMRTVGIAPKGQIAEHSHKDRPGIVTVVQGEIVEGQPTGENTFTADGYGSFPEQEDTVHWVYNRSDTPATAIVCDIAKEE